MGTPYDFSSAWGDMCDAWEAMCADPSLDHYDRSHLAHIGESLWALSGEQRLRAHVETVAARYRIRLHGLPAVVTPKVTTVTADDTAHIRPRR